MPSSTRTNMASALAASIARDEDHDGFWSLLRFWVRPQWGISQDKLPLCPGSFQSVHNARRRGNALLGALVLALVGWLKPAPRNPARIIQAETQASRYERLIAVSPIATELSRAAGAGGC